MSIAFSSAKGLDAYRTDQVDRLLRACSELSPFQIRATDLRAPRLLTSDGYSCREVDRFVEGKAREAAARDAASGRIEPLPTQERLSTRKGFGWWWALYGGLALLALGWYWLASGSNDLWPYAMVGLGAVWLAALAVGRWRSSRDSATCMPDGLHLQRAAHDTVVPWDQIDYARLEQHGAGEHTVYRLALHLANGGIAYPEMLNDCARAAIARDSAVIGRWCDRFRGTAIPGP